MDLSLAQTFLEITRTHSFLRAAERLNISPTSVSARIRALEEMLGRPLFVRNKAGAALTAAGKQFVPHATSLLQVWERARQQVAVPPDRRAVLSVGCEASLWEPLLLRWLLRMRSEAPHLAIRTRIGESDELLEKTAAGGLDLSIVYAPQQRAGLRVELLIEEKLVMVTTAMRPKRPTPKDYVYVDWGADFAVQHGLAFPELSNAAVKLDLGPLGREYLLSAGGTGYFRLDVVRSHVESGRLRRVPNMPEFLYPAFAAYAPDAEPTLVQPALAALREVTLAFAGAKKARRSRKA